MPRASRSRTAIPSAWQRMAREASRRRRRLQQPLSELGGGRSGEMGAARLRLRARRFPRLPAARPASSTTCRRARPRTSTTASNGPACSPGRTARSGSTASPTTPSTSGTWPRCSRRTSPPCASGKAPPTSIASMTHHGGILCTFPENWYDMQVKTVQHGAGERGKRSRVHGELVCGPRDPERGGARGEPLRLRHGRSSSHPLDDDLSRARSPIWSKVKTPLLSAANWGGQGLHPRGNFEGFVRAAAKEKWLEVHGIEHWTHFYTDYGRELQKRFFDYFLHGKNNGWDKQPQVQLQVRHVDKFVERAENEWPLERTQMDEASISIRRAARSRRKRASGQGGRRPSTRMGDGVTFLTAAARAGDRDHRAVGAEAVRVVLDQRCRPLRRAARVHRRPARRWCSRARSIRTRRSRQGWLRASHRKLDKKLSTPYRPYHTHDEKQPLKQGEVVELDIEIWPTSIVVPAGYRIGAHHPRQGLRLCRPERRQALELQERADRLRPVPARRPARPAAGHLRRRHQPAFRRRQGALSPAADHSAAKQPKRGRREAQGGRAQPAGTNRICRHRSLRPSGRLSPLARNPQASDGCRRNISGTDSIRG